MHIENEYHAVPERFPCFRCGACCLDISNVPDISDWATPDGVCRYYSPEGCTCQIYDNRPAICNIWRTYRRQYEKEGVSWDDFVYTNMLNCCLLRYLNEIPEPEDSPFYGEQEEIASALLQDMRSPRLAPPASPYENEPKIGKLAEHKNKQKKQASTSRPSASRPIAAHAAKRPAKPEPIDLNGPLDLDVPDIGDLGMPRRPSAPSRKPNKHRGELLD